MKETLDTLAAKAEALEAMLQRNDPNYSEAFKLYKRDLNAYRRGLETILPELIKNLKGFKT